MLRSFRSMSWVVALSMLTILPGGECSNGWVYCTSGLCHQLGRQLGGCGTLWHSCGGVGGWSYHWLVGSAMLMIYFRFWGRGRDVEALVLSAFGGSVRFSHGGGGPEKGC